MRGLVPVDERAKWGLITGAGLLVAVCGALLSDTAAGPRWAVFAVLGLIAAWVLLQPRQLYLTGLHALTVTAMWLSPGTTFLLFAVLPEVYRRIPLRPAFWVMLAFVAPPWLFAWARTGDPTAMLLVLLPTALFSQLFGWVIRTLAERNLVIAELSHEAGVAAERERLSAEIHDTLAQGFTSIVTLVQAARADPARADDHLDLALRTARENLAESRALVAALAPAALEGTLADALRRQVERVADFGVRAEFAERGAGVVPRAVEVVLLRAAQEALTNARRHAARVRVELDVLPDSVRLTVRDDGPGYRGAPEGFGLRGMRARLEQVGGMLTRFDEDGAVLVAEAPR